MLLYSCRWNLCFFLKNNISSIQWFFQGAPPPKNPSQVPNWFKERNERSILHEVFATEVPCFQVRFQQQKSRFGRFGWTWFAQRKVQLPFLPESRKRQNCPKWNETHIGDIPICHWTMIMGGKVGGWIAQKSFGKVLNSWTLWKKDTVLEYWKA